MMMEILFCLVIAYYLVKNTGLEAYKTATGKQSAAHRERIERSKAGVQTVPDAFTGRLAYWMTPKPDKPAKDRGAARETAATIWRYSWEDGRNRFIRHHDRKVEGTLPRQRARRAVVGAAKRVPTAVRDVRNSEIRTAKRELKRNPRDAGAHDRYWGAVDAKKGRPAGPTVVDPAPEVAPTDVTESVHATVDPPVEPTDAVGNVFPLRPAPEVDADSGQANQESDTSPRPQSYAEIREAITERWSTSDDTTGQATAEVPPGAEKDTNGQQATTEGTDDSMDEKERQYWANPIGAGDGTGNGTGSEQGVGPSEVMGVDSLRAVYESTQGQAAGLHEQLNAAKERMAAIGSTYEQGTAHLSSAQFDSGTINGTIQTQELAATAQRLVDQATAAVEALSAAASVGYQGLEKFRHLEEAATGTPEAANVQTSEFATN